MPKIRVNGVDLHYEEHGAGPETVVFAHGLLCSGRMFDGQVRALRDLYRCITFDFRGQGRSPVAKSGYDMDTLAADAAALIEALRCVPCHFVGLSMGGFVGLRLAIRRPELLRSLVLLGSSAEAEPGKNLPRYRMLSFIARWFGIRLVVGRVMPILFGRTFLADPERANLREEWRRRLLANDRVGISRATRGVLDREGVSEQLDKIDRPTLIVVGDEDVATPPATAQRIHARIRGSKLVVLPGTGHTSTVESPAAVNAELLEFLQGSPDWRAGRP